MYVLHVTRDPDVGGGQGLVVLDVESDADLTACPDCGVVAVGHGRRDPTSSLETLVDADLDTLATALYVKIDDLLRMAPQRAPWRVGGGPEVARMAGAVAVLGPSGQLAAAHVAKLAARSGRTLELTYLRGGMTMAVTIMPAPIRRG